MLIIKLFLLKDHAYVVLYTKKLAKKLHNRNNITIQVLEYIKRAKAWRNNAWNDDESGRPSSYLMEVLVIKAYEDIGSLDSPER